MDFDVVIVGAGLSGLCSAWLLHKNHQIDGRIAVIDRNDQYPAAFRAEKIEPHQAEVFRQFGVLKFRKPLADPIEEIDRVRNGRLTRGSVGEQYGIRYHDTVNELRKQLIPLITFIKGRVIELQTAQDIQTITLDTGRTISCKLILLCTGGHSPLLEKLSIKPATDPHLRSRSFGFDIARTDNQPFTFKGLNYFLDSSQSQLDYITLFLIGETMRVNLFTQWEAKDTRVKSFRADPISSLQSYFPKLFEYTAPFKLISKMETFPTRYYRLSGVEQAGIVILADEFQSVSPTTGTGLNKVTTDVDLLCNYYIPRWLQTPGMAQEKIREFYNDPRKQEIDKNAKQDWVNYYNSAFKNGLLDKLKRKLGRLLGLEQS